MIDNGYTGKEHLELIEGMFARQSLAVNGITQLTVRTLLTPDLFLGDGSTGYAFHNGILRNCPGLFFHTDLDTLSESNGPRQFNSHAQIGNGKAEDLAKSGVALIPTLPVIFDPNGVQAGTFGQQMDAVMEYTEKMNAKLKKAGLEPIQPIAFDGIDVTKMPGWEAKLIAHQEAQRCGVDTVNAFDVGKRSQFFYFPYHKPNEPLLHGKVTAADVENENVNPQELNLALMPKWLGKIPNVPKDYAQQYIARARTIVEAGPNDEKPGMPQERIASSLSEAEVPQIHQAILEGKADDIPLEFAVETHPESFRNKLETCLIFAAGQKVLKMAGEKDQ
jgi:hypothetical protein